MHDRLTGSAAVVAAVALAWALVTPSCGDDGASAACVRPPGCPSSMRCCDAANVCADLVCQGIVYVCREGAAQPYQWMREQTCLTDASADATVDGDRGPDAPSHDAMTDIRPTDVGPTDVGPTDVGPTDTGPPTPDAGCPYGAAGNHKDPCGGVAAETWRCVFSSAFGSTVSQVCRGGEWINFELTPRDCPACCGVFSAACRQ